MGWMNRPGVVALGRVGLTLVLAATPCLTEIADAEVFKCVGADGKVSYQDAPCAQGSSGTSVRIESVAPRNTGVSRQIILQTPQPGGSGVAPQQPAPSPSGTQPDRPKPDPCGNARPPAGGPPPPPDSAAALAPGDRALLESRCGMPTWPTEAAITAANRLGEGGDAKALAVIADLHSDRLVMEFRSGFTRYRGAIPPAIEQVILARIEDDKLGEGLVLLLAGTPVCGDHRYASRELFDALRARFVRRGGSSVASALTCSTLPDVDATLAALLGQVRDPLVALPLVHYFKERRAPVAVPALVAVQSAVPLGRDVNGFYGAVNNALLAIGNDDAIRALDMNMQWLAKNAAERNAGYVVETLMHRLSVSPPNTRVRYESVKALWKAFPQPSVQRYYVEWVQKWRVVEAIPDLYEMLDTGNGPLAATAVLEIGTPADWKQLDRRMAASAGSGSASWANPQGKALRDRISVAAKAPDTAIAEKAERQRQQSFVEARDQLKKERNALVEVGKSDPKRYVTAEEELLKRSVALARENSDRFPDSINLRRESIAGYGRLGAYRRFTQRDPRGAVESYARGIAVPFEPASVTDDPRVSLRLGKADTLRFDLNDRPGALREYRETLALIAQARLSSNDIDETLRSLALAYLKAEIAFLEQGTRSLQPDDRACQGIWAVMIYGRDFFAADDPPLQAIIREASPPGKGLDPPELARRLEALAPTPVHLLATFQWWPTLATEARVAGFLRKHDPSGFLTACVLRVIQTASVSETLVSRLQPSERQPAMGPWSPGDLRLMQNAARLAISSAPATTPEARK